MPELTGSEGAAASLGPAGVYRHDRQHVKRQIQRTGRDLPLAPWKRLQQTLAAVLLEPRTRFTTAFPGVLLVLESQGSFTILAEDGHPRPGRAADVARETVATGSWRQTGEAVELHAAVVYGCDVLPTAASQCRLGSREGALWIDLGTVDGHAWSLRFERQGVAP